MTIKRRATARWDKSKEGDEKRENPLTGVGMTNRIDFVLGRGVFERFPRLHDRHQQLGVCYRVGFADRYVVQ